MSVLKTRTITGVIFGTVVILAILGGEISSILLFGVIVLFASYELSRMLRREFQDFMMMLTFVGGAAPYILSLYYPLRGEDLSLLIYFAALIFTIFAIMMFSNALISKLELFSPLTSLFYLGLSFYLLRIVFLKPPFNWQLLLSIIIIIWASDTFAYLIGSRFGKHKIYPKISPGKSWEGFLGAGIFTIATGILLHYIFDYQNIYFFISMAAVVWFIGLIGDFFESALKRYFKLKDSGSFLPGHGGFLDRFDSFIFVIPFVSLLLLIFKMI